MNAFLAIHLEVKVQLTRLSRDAIHLTTAGILDALFIIEMYHMYT